MDAENDYRRKLKTRDELREIIGPRPRERSVVMCHGAFDLVHPGHIRHMMYAKSKADILVASLTSDAHISKAEYRPFVPQELRAMNLAALEVVDYVIIDEYPWPIENILALEPDFFAKGYEYSTDGVHPKTREEIVALDGYGGQIIFTPGDLVLSSSAFIEAEPPRISTDKLVTLMDSEGVTFDTLRTILESFKGAEICILGDTIVDSYTYCSLISSGAAKTPTLSVKYEDQADFAGGAAVVAKHIRQAGAKLKLLTVLGDDALKEMVLDEMAKYDIDCEPTIDPTRVTTQKNVYIAANHRMLKVDKVDNRPISNDILNGLKSQLSSISADAFIFSDYRHGIFNRVTIPQLQSSLPDGPLRVADSQVASRWGNILEFQDFDLITPNEREARFSLGDQDSTIRPLALELYKKARCKTLILTLGDRGIMTYRAPNESVRSFFSVDSFVDSALDPVGAGDALLAYSTLGLATTGSELVASILGSMAAGVACERDGNNPVSSEDVGRKLDLVEQQASYS